MLQQRMHHKTWMYARWGLLCTHGKMPDFSAQVRGLPEQHRLPRRTRMQSQCLQDKSCTPRLQPSLQSWRILLRQPALPPHTGNLYIQHRLQHQRVLRPPDFHLKTRLFAHMRPKEKQITHRQNQPRLLQQLRSLFAFEWLPRTRSLHPTTQTSTECRTKLPPAQRPQKARIQRLQSRTRMLER